MGWFPRKSCGSYSWEQNQSQKQNCVGVKPLPLLGPSLPSRIMWPRRPQTPFRNDFSVLNGQSCFVNDQYTIKQVVLLLQLIIVSLTWLHRSRLGEGHLQLSPYGIFLSSRLCDEFISSSLHSNLQALGGDKRKNAGSQKQFSPKRSGKFTLKWESGVSAHLLLKEDSWGGVSVWWGHLHDTSFWRLRMNCKNRSGRNKQHWRDYISFMCPLNASGSPMRSFTNCSGRKERHGTYSRSNESINTAFKVYLKL